MASSDSEGDVLKISDEACLFGRIHRAIGFCLSWRRGRSHGTAFWLAAWPVYTVEMQECCVSIFLMLNNSNLTQNIPLLTVRDEGWIPILYSDSICFHWLRDEIEKIDQGMSRKEGSETVKPSDVSFPQKWKVVLLFYENQCRSTWSAHSLWRELQDCHLVLVLLPLVQMAVNMILLEVMLLLTATSQAAVLSCPILFTLSVSPTIHLAVKKVMVLLLPHTNNSQHKCSWSFGLLGSRRMWATLKQNRCSGLVVVAWTSPMFLSYSSEFDSLCPYNNRYGDANCGLCERLLSQRSSWGSCCIVRGGDTPIAGVLSCWHVYHAECLECNTPKLQKHDPPCPLCEKSEENASEQWVLCRLKNEIPRLRSLGEEGPSSRVWSCVQAGDCVEGALYAPKQSDEEIGSNRFMRQVWEDSGKKETRNDENQSSTINGNQLDKTLFPSKRDLSPAFGSRAQFFMSHGYHRRSDCCDHATNERPRGGSQKPLTIANSATTTAGGATGGVFSTFQA
ncbi:LOW QUALITY PROTEIN: uncharacterized protein [Elaeis guineensis]|uniref:LOW QUALITY PROTEIN: uncharacterized protein n=1 Tax=Elaeis guineensis var. tenera TaxID=51953 RepID=UPI003C6D79FB